MLVALSMTTILPSPSVAYKTTGGISINGDQEILADPARPIIYWAHPNANSLSFLDAYTGNEISTIIVGPGPMSVDLSPDRSWLYVAVAGANQTVVINASSKAIARAIPLEFSPLSVRAGPNDRLYVSGAQDGIVRILNATTGLVLDAIAPMNAPLPWLLEVSPDGLYILVHLLTNWQERIGKYGVAGDRFTFLAGDSQDLGENFYHMAIDWAGGLAYLVSGTPYGIEIVSLSDLTRLGWLPMSNYPAGVGVMPGRNVVIGIHRNFGDGALWVFNASTRAQVNKVPIRPSPSGYLGEDSLMVVSEIAGRVLVWTEDVWRVLTIDPSIFPGNPSPDSDVPGYPGFYLTAHIWRGLIEPASNTTTISVDGKRLSGEYEAAWDLLRAPAPVLPVGRHHVNAIIAWADGSESVTWNFTVTSPLPAALFRVQTEGPLVPGQLIEFDAGDSTALGTITAYLWKFGDGSTAFGVRVSHAFVSPGGYPITLTITTDLGVSGSQTREVAITPPGLFAIPPAQLATLMAVTAGFIALAIVVVVGRRSAVPRPGTARRRK